jgi:hypothetical protein
MSNKQKAIFSGNIISAYYFDQDYTTIEILYKIKDEIHNYIVEADPDNADYKALLAEGWDVNKLAKSTEQYKKEQSFEFNNAIQTSVDTILQQSKLAIKQEWLDEQAKNPDVLDIRSSNPFISGDMFDLILEKNTDKDMLFKFKLWALELNDIKKSTKATKTEIRKSKSILEGMAVISPLILD